MDRREIEQLEFAYDTGYECDRDLSVVALCRYVLDLEIEKDQFKHATEALERSVIGLHKEACALKIAKDCLESRNAKLEAVKRLTKKLREIESRLDYDTRYRGGYYMVQLQDAREHLREKIDAALAAVEGDEPEAIDYLSGLRGD